MLVRLARDKAAPARIVPHFDCLEISLMIYMRVARPVGRIGLLVACAATLAASSWAVADAYDPPTTYYQNATGNGATLKSQLYTITTTGFVSRSYGDARYAFGLIDKDPNNSSNILLAYNRASVNGTWDAGATFNREHVWPKSLLNLTSSQVSNTYRGVASDLFELRPTNPNINSSRGNMAYGSIYGTVPNYGSMSASDGSGTYWYPGGADRGDVARSIFYMATRYGQGQTNNLSLKNGQAITYQFGDKESLLHWHYQDEVDTFERQRNQYIYSQALNPTYYQGNRNPYIDHPEYVWSVFGNGANTSQLSVATPAADGSSSVGVDFGRVIAGSNFSSQSLTLNKTGSTPTTFDVVVAGSVASTLDGSRHSFDYGSQARNLTVSVAGSTATIGSRNGTISFNNTDITAGAAAGQGAADGDDVINVTAAVVAHADPSFSLVNSVKALSLDFGIVARDSTSPELAFEIANFSTIANDAFTAGLDLDNIVASGNAEAFSTDLATTTNLAAGTTRTQSASILTTALGSFDASFSVATSDENIPGATSLGDISLSLHGRVAIGGDATLNDSVDFDDLLLLAQNYGVESTFWQTGDFTRDGLTSFDDLLILAQNYGTAGILGDLGEQFASDFAADWALARSLVPEPTMIAALLMPALSLGRRRSC
jgi:endonuclease I